MTRVLDELPRHPLPSWGRGCARSGPRGLLLAAALLGVAAPALAPGAAAPAFAQEAIQEPGAFAFYYPNLDVLNGGAPTPAYRMEGLPPSVMQSYNERDSSMASPNVWQHRRVHHASGTMHDGRRHG